MHQGKDRGHVCGGRREEGTAAGKVVWGVFIQVTLKEILEGESESSRYLVGDCSGSQNSLCKGPEAEVGMPSMSEG